MKLKFKSSYYIFYFVLLIFIIGNPFKVFSQTNTNNSKISIVSNQCYPNPFDKNIEVTTIKFVIFSQKALAYNNIAIVIYDYNGKKVWTKQIQQVSLVVGNTTFLVPWGGENDLGNKVANGLYYGKIIFEGSNTLTAVVKILVK